MTKPFSALLLLLMIGACDNAQPLDFDATDTEETEETEEPEEAPSSPSEILAAGTRLPAGDSVARSTQGTTRLEARNDEGGGLLATATYNESSDTFVIDGLGFDGANTYTPGTAVDSLLSYAVYDADVQAIDSVTGDPITQFQYRAIYGESTNTVDGDPRTSFVIVRTGSYVDFGFGGFVYEREGGVRIPDNGQAVYTGDYAGMRVFRNAGGIEYTTGDMSIAIDFEDFNANDAVRGRLTNREAFTATGAPIILGDAQLSELELPDVTFAIQEGAPSLQTNGEISGNVGSITRDNSGAAIPYETGFFYAVLAGDATGGDGGEIVGVIVMESPDPRFESVTAQETGGFILYRGATN